MSKHDSGASAAPDRGEAEPGTQDLEQLLQGPQALTLLDVPLTRGRELPPLLHHSFHEFRKTTKQHPKFFREPHFQVGIQKPRGGFWGHPVLSPAGKWRPFPHESTWTQWCASEMPEWITGATQRRIHVDPEAQFIVIDSVEDLRALYAAYPVQGDPEHAALIETLPSLIVEEMRVNLDWRGMYRSGAAGIYLTERGQRATRHHGFSDLPRLDMWDFSAVWFCYPAYHLGKPWKTRAPRED